MTAPGKKVPPPVSQSHIIVGKGPQRKKKGNRAKVQRVAHGSQNALLDLKQKVEQKAKVDVHREAAQTRRMKAPEYALGIIEINEKNNKVTSSNDEDASTLADDSNEVVNTPPETDDEGNAAEAPELESDTGGVAKADSLNNGVYPIPGEEHKAAEETNITSQEHELDADCNGERHIDDRVEDTPQDEDHSAHVTAHSKSDNNEAKSADNYVALSDQETSNAQDIEIVNTKGFVPITENEAAKATSEIESTNVLNNATPHETVVSVTAELDVLEGTGASQDTETTASDHVVDGNGAVESIQEVNAGCKPGQATADICADDSLQGQDDITTTQDGTTPDPNSDSLVAKGMDADDIATTADSKSNVDGDGSEEDIACVKSMDIADSDTLGAANNVIVAPEVLDTTVRAGHHTNIVESNNSVEDTGVDDNTDNAGAPQDAEVTRNDRSANGVDVTQEIPSPKSSDKSEMWHGDSGEEEDTVTEPSHICDSDGDSDVDDLTGLSEEQIYRKLHTEVTAGADNNEEDDRLESLSHDELMDVLKDEIVTTKRNLESSNTLTHQDITESMNHIHMVKDFLSLVIGDVGIDDRDTNEVLISSQDDSDPADVHAQGVTNTEFPDADIVEPQSLDHIVDQPVMPATPSGLPDGPGEPSFAESTPAVADENAEVNETVGMNALRNIAENFKSTISHEDIDDAPANADDFPAPTIVESVPSVSPGDQADDNSQAEINYEQDLELVAVYPLGEFVGAPINPATLLALPNSTPVPDALPKLANLIHKAVSAVEHQLKKSEPSANLNANEPGDMEGSEVLKEATEAAIPDMGKLSNMDSEQWSNGGVILEELQPVEGLKSSHTPSLPGASSSEDIDEISGRQLGEFDGAPVTYERLVALPNSTAEAVKPMVRSAKTKSIKKCRSLTSKSQHASFEDIVKQDGNAVLESIRSAKASLDNAKSHPLSYKNLQAHAKNAIQPTGQLEPRIRCSLGKSNPSSNGSSSTTKSAQASNTFLGICSLADFMEELVIDENGTTSRDDVISAFGRLSIMWQDFIGVEPALSTLEQLQIPVTQARTKLGNISLHNFLSSIDFNNDDTTSIVNVATAFREAAEVDARPPSAQLAKLLKMEAQLKNVQAISWLR